MLVYDDLHSYTAGILARDSGYPPQEMYFYVTLNITDENDPPTDIKLTNQRLLENRPIGELVTSVMVMDTEELGNYTLRMESEAPFVLDGMDLVLADRLDFETQPGYEAIVTVIDGDHTVSTEEIQNGSFGSILKNSGNTGRKLGGAG